MSGDTLSDQSTNKLDIIEILQEFLKDAPEETMKYFINSDEAKISHEKLRLMLDKNPDKIPFFQELYKQLFEIILFDLPEDNYLTSMCADMNIQDEINFEKSIFMIPIHGKLILPPLYEKMSNSKLKNVFDNYPKWLKDNAQTFDKEKYNKFVSNLYRA